MEKHAKQLHVRMSQEELDRARQLADTLGMTLSDLVRVLVQAPAPMVRPVSPRHGKLPSGELPPSILIVIDRSTAVGMRREMRRWGHHYNQAVHALNAIAYYMRLDEADATDALEELGKVNDKLNLMDVGVSELRTAVAELTARPIAYL